jgi:AcrR family transcriptional regulator
MRAEATMAVQQRAVDRERKVARREALLDAAERLLDADPTRVPSVAEVADAAGLAKGTVYLYFASKERLLIALYERQIEAFFGALAAFLDPRLPWRLDAVPEQVLAWLADHPLFVALAAHCHRTRSDLDPAADSEAGRALSFGAATLAAERLARRVEAPGGESARSLVWQSLALVVGLAQLGRPQDIASGVRALWRGFGARAGADPRPQATEATAAGTHAGGSAW